MFAGLLLVANLLLIGAAWQDGSWGAGLMAYFGGPLLNVAFVVVGLASIPVLKLIRPQFAIVLPFFLTLVLPVVAAAMDYLIITSMMEP